MGQVRDKDETKERLALLQDLIDYVEELIAALQKGSRTPFLIDVMDTIQLNLSNTNRHISNI